MQTEAATTLTLIIGKRRYPVASLAEASAKFCAARDKSGLGASRIATPHIYQGEELLGHVAYNGRIFAGHPFKWTPNTPLLFETWRPETIAKLSTPLPAQMI